MSRLAAILLAAAASVVLAAPASARSSDSNPRCTDFAVVGDHEAPSGSATNLVPVTGGTRLTFVCSNMKNATRTSLYVKIDSPSGYFSGGKLGGPLTDPVLTGGNPYDKPKGPAVGRTPAADCLAATPLSHAAECGFESEYVDGTYALYWLNSDAKSNPVSSCGLVATVTVLLRGPNAAGRPTDTPIGSAKDVHAGCHTAGAHAAGTAEKPKFDFDVEISAPDTIASAKTPQHFDVKVTVTNVGPGESNAIASDTLDALTLVNPQLEAERTKGNVVDGFGGEPGAQLHVTSAPAGCHTNGNFLGANYVCALPSLASHGEKTYTFTVTWTSLNRRRLQIEREQNTRTHEWKSFDIILEASVNSRSCEDEPGCTNNRARFEVIP